MECQGGPTWPTVRTRAKATTRPPAATASRSTGTRRKTDVDAEARDAEKALDRDKGDLTSAEAKGKARAHEIDPEAKKAVTDRNPLLPHPTAAGAAPPARRPRARASRAVAALIGGTAAVALLAGPAAAEPTSPAAGLAQTASAKTASAKTASAKPALAKPDALKQVAQRSALVADIQRALNRLGYDAGRSTGSWAAAPAARSAPISRTRRCWRPVSRARRCASA